MLVLGRKPGEYVMIGKDIMVKVVKSEEGDLRLAIDAPKSINIIRGEIYERTSPSYFEMRKENKINDTKMVFAEIGKGTETIIQQV